MERISQSADKQQNPVVIGVDGCRAGWIAAIDINDTIVVDVYPTFMDLLTSWSNAFHILVDIPIGLPCKIIPSRECDVLARKLLGSRASSVFSPPCRQAAYAATIEEARKLNILELHRSLSAQAWGICRKIAEVDQVLLSNRDLQEKVYEVHPEVCFSALNGSRPMNHSKRTSLGKKERLDLLTLWERQARDVVETVSRRYKRCEVQVDDVLDAMVALITARSKKSNFNSMPDPPQVDEKGMPMRIIYSSQHRNPVR